MKLSGEGVLVGDKSRNGIVLRGLGSPGVKGEPSTAERIGGKGTISGGRHVRKCGVGKKQKPSHS